MVEIAIVVEMVGMERDGEKIGPGIEGDFPGQLF